MINVEKFIRPETIGAAVSLLKAPDCIVLAGGTGVTLSRDPNVRTVIDLSDLQELKSIDITDERIRLGAMVTMTQLRRASGLPAALVTAARAIGSTPLRNVITVGGELARGVYWNDLPVALLAMDAVVEIASEAGVEKLPIAAFLAEHPKKTLAGGKLITAVEIERRFTHVGYLKFARTEVDYAICNLACGLRVEDGVIREARVAVGAIVPLARRIPEAEQSLVGTAPGEEAFVRAAKALVEAIEPRPDFRVSREYQRQLMESLTRRVLEAASQSEQ
ncbi:FAD binding domain-containing protein [Myxococcota bacterium]|nr:FAD binding domain-containing protein [Myxococcota bacterium]